MTPPDRSSEARHPIRVVADRTGVSPTLLRAWERRYGVVEPERSEGRQRLYSDRQIERLRALKQAVDGGRSIGTVADLSTEEVQALVAEDLEARVALKSSVPAGGPTVSLDTAMDAVRAMDAPGLDRELRRLTVTLGAERFLDEMLAPLLATIGEEWRAGRLRPAQEHVATAVVKQILGWLLERSRSESDRRVVVGMLSGEHHGLGGLLAATSAALAEWDVLFLGEDLPPAEIAAAARAMRAEVVGLSIASPLSWDGVPGQLQELLDMLEPGTRVILGGAFGSDLGEIVDHPAITAVRDLASFRALLRGMPA
jgi:DNA-binding transcriptional MerR regulator/methylmalonyl-CoA mutase cobalamin-binding subunit